MALPALHHPCWQKLANGGLAKLESQNLGAQLLVKRLERSQAPIAERAAEVHAFFVKWERILVREISLFNTL
ncbi:hypothetical protein [Herbaspirillum rubrisubalbicans]|uniref:Uncharacterized protein n=1 Tax=Herbaspirillum rubrisubalbicans TaxID=80842 RepID=A0AAD0U9R9_9BURK|nr:hypothetical protein [Herbaspirillum rubrisubalbicans]AYR23710.1 hypothetical protein RC54_07655 [Herbaspirillum rubrisubalbicans]